jgi:hypothetical protein
MTTRSRAAGAVLTLMVAWVAPLRAQPAQQVAECEGGPLAVVAQFLSLAPEQIEALAQSLRERQEALAPIQQEIARREQRIRELIASGGDPAEIGRLVIEIQQLRQLAEAAQAAFLARFQSLLNDEQRRRWQQVQVAARLQPALPAFQALSLL